MEITLIKLFWAVISAWFALLNSEENSQPMVNYVTITSVEDTGYELPTYKGITYNGSNLCDGDTITAWAIKLHSGGGIVSGPTLLLKPTRIRSVELWNGYQKSRDTFYNNSRPKYMKIFRMDYGEYADFDYPMSEVIYEGPVMDIIGKQTLEVSDTFDNSCMTQKVGIFFRDSEEDVFVWGNKWSDLCISELRIVGY